jgi:hypothetical protein
VVQRLIDQEVSLIVHDRLAWLIFASAANLLLAPAASRALGRDQPAARPRVFRIQIIEEGTGRGVPLVELRTVNQIRYFTDSNGIVAFDEPGLLGRKVFFTITSHGYEVDKDGLGFRGKALDMIEGGSAQIMIRRLNIARRLYRVTGQGIYRDSVLTGDPAPIREPLLNGQVLGQDSVVSAVFQGKIHWFWGDTHRPDYPLGNFHVPGATSELPGQGGLAPETGVNLSYFVDDKGFVRPTCPMPGEGPTWISGLIVVNDHEGRERMFAVYAKVRKVLEVYERGLAEFNRETARFDKIVKFPEPSAYSGEFPDGHPFLHRDHGVDYIYYANPYPLIRVPAGTEQLKTPTSWEAYTCLKQGTRFSQQQLDRGPDGVLRYAWKTNTQLVRQEQEGKLLSARLMRQDEALLNLRDIDSSKLVVAHGGSVYWNEYRSRWAMIAVESFGSSSLLGEVWYAEADTPLGPWVYARKVLTHDKYSFYNPKRHPMFDQDGGRIVYFEGTYATTFSGNPDPTPRYDYNQVMYQLDLSDERLALPVAIYQASSGPNGPARLAPKTALSDRERSQPHRALFFAPDRAGIAWLPVYEQSEAGQGQTLRVGAAHEHRPETPGPRPLFYILPDDVKDYTAATVQLREYQAKSGGERFYSALAPTVESRAGWTSRVLGRVWRNPAPMRPWTLH